MTAIEGGSFEDALEWMKSEEGDALQKHLEEKIIQLLFSQEGYPFLQMAAQLAWFGSRPESRSALVHDVIHLKISLDHSIEPCKLHLMKKLGKLGDFLVENKKPILIGVALVATAIALSYLTGDPLNVVINGIVVAGSGSIFAFEEEKFQLPETNFSESEIAALQKAQQPPETPQIPSPNEVERTPEGIWANGFFYSNEWLNKSHFAEQFAALYPSIALPPPSPSSQPPPFAQEREPIPTYRTPPRLPPGFSAEEVPIVISQNFALLEANPSQGNSSYGYIGWMNGIDNTFQDSKASALYLQKLANGQTIHGIYNCSHTVAVDLCEAAFLNHAGVSLITADLLRREWAAFHEANAHRPNAKILWFCHSQGAIHARNALESLPPEIRDRVIVIAIAPGAIVPDSLCFKSRNYASERDIVYKLQPGPAPVVQGVTLDDVLLPTIEYPPLECRDQLIILPAHEGATGIDHSFQSPTYEKVIKIVLDDYKAHQGEYLPEEKGR